MASDDEIIANVRRISGVESDKGPDDAHILAGVQGFASAFDYWYIRVIKAAVKDYRKLIVARVNPFIRRVELAGLTAAEAGSRLVDDYARRNFVTAGGWALEELAIASSETMQKSAAEGIDAQRLDPKTSEYHLYVLKSGLVTRNSDIVRAIKTHGRQAEKLLRQGRGTSGVSLNYVVLTGKTSSTFEDGVARPSSGEFWGEALGLEATDAIELALGMAAEAGRLVTSDASVHINAMKTLTSSYISLPSGPGVDWDFLAQRTMQVKEVWKTEDQRRHAAGLAELEKIGYEPEAAPQGVLEDAIAEQIADLEATSDELADPSE